MYINDRKSVRAEEILNGFPDSAAAARAIEGCIEKGFIIQNSLSKEFIIAPAGEKQL